MFKRAFSILFLIAVTGILLSNTSTFNQNISPSGVDSFSLSKGKMIYTENCAGCHGLNGEGSYGPNLCDNYYLHGHHYHGIVHVIKHGSKKGMSAFNHNLSHAEIRDVAHYVYIRLKGTNPPGAKTPQGKLHKHK